MTTRIRSSSLILAVAALAGCGSSVSTISPIPPGDSRCPSQGGIAVKSGDKEKVICNGGGQLVAVGQVPVGDAHCPSGGEVISIGTDDGSGGGVAGNDVLEPGEVTSTQYVCTGAAFLTKQVTLPVGDAHCPNGGTAVETGYDNAADGGTAGNGQLDPGEVTSIQYICNGAAFLTKQVTLPVGDVHCPNGGTAVLTGYDNAADGGTAGNGLLDPGEVTNTQYLCTPAPVLTAEVTLPIGDAHCPPGGVELDVGLDNGANGGTPGDGVLQAGEITTRQYVCTQDGTHIGSITAPAGSPGPYSINASGGNGVDGGGGGSYGLTAQFAFGTNGGHLKIWNTGVADAGFAVPVPPQGSLGATPLSVTTNLTVTWRPDTTGAGLDAGQYFIAGSGGSPIYLWSDAGTAVPVTGLSVAANAKLTFETDGTGVANVTVDQSLVNAGTITTATLADGVSKGSLQLSVADFVGTKTSAIVLKGAAGNASTPGGSGGQLDVRVLTGFGGAFFNQGAIDVSGGDGSNGGSGGSVRVAPKFGLINTGNITTRGGAGTVNAGGNAGTINLSSSSGDLDNSGNLDASGGNGASLGGRGGAVSLSPGSLGGFGAFVNARAAMRNSGSISTAGGNVGTACAGTCLGGSGGNVALSAQGGDLVSSGAIILGGGFGGAGVGGRGGSLQISAANARNGTVPAGNITVSGSLDTHGGSGAIGGWSGQINVTHDSYTQAMGQEVVFLGYGGGINVSGGNGTASGGAGGTVRLYNTWGWDNSGNRRGVGGKVMGGSIINAANINAKGGASGAGPGGNGGILDLHTQSSVAFFQQAELAINSGTVDVSGGDGATGGGNSGWVGLFGRSGLSNSGNLTSSGGVGTGAGASGGSAGFGSLSSDSGPVTNSGALVSNGGNGSGTGSSGGNGGWCTIRGTTVKNTGPISAIGGNGAATGGDGNSVSLTSTSGTTTNTGTFAVSGGTGTTAGAKGSVTIDGHPVP